MLPRLQAEEALMALQLRFASNDRMLAERDQAEYVAQLSDAAKGGRKEKPTVKTLESMGITVREE